MSQENVEIVRDGLGRFAATREFPAERVTADFVWDMSNFHGWPEQQVYEGAEGARSFLREWTDAWEDWEIEIDALHHAGDRVVAVMRQRGWSKEVGMPVEMRFAQVWTLRDGKEARMDMYSDPDEALEATGLSEQVMLEENVEQLRAAIEAFNRRDGAKFDALLTDDVEIVPVRAALEGTTYQGSDAGSQYCAAVDDTWESLRWEVDEIREAGESAVAVGHIRGMGRGTGATIDTSGGWVAQFRDGLITRFRTYTNRDDALEAAGLGE